MMRVLFFVLLLAPMPLWSGEYTASVYMRGDGELGLLTPLRVGLGKDMEMQLRVPWVLALPHVGVKKQWYAAGRYQFASLHSLGYPTWFMALFSRAGTGGLLPAHVVPGQRLSLHNRLLWTQNYAGYDATLYAGAFHTLGARRDDAPTIDYPFFYSRMASWYTGFSFYGGMHVRAALSSMWKLSLNLQRHHMPGFDRDFAWEQTLLLHYLPGKQWAWASGVEAVYGRYPFGRDTHLYPLLNVRWRW